MNPAFDWSPELVERLLILHKNGLSIRRMAIRLHISRPIITLKLATLGLKEPQIQPEFDRNVPRPVVLKEAFTGRFEDIDRPDRDKHAGPKPQRQFNRSLNGCAAYQCTR